MAIKLKRKYIFQTVFWSIHVSFQGCGCVSLDVMIYWNMLISYSRWWFQIFFMFTLFGQMIQFDWYFPSIAAMQNLSVLEDFHILRIFPTVSNNFFTKTFRCLKWRVSWDLIFDYFLGQVSPYLSRIHTAYIGEDSSIFRYLKCFNHFSQGFTRRGTWQQDRPIRWEVSWPTTNVGGLNSGKLQQKLIPTKTNAWQYWKLTQRQWQTFLFGIKYLIWEI